MPIVLGDNRYGKCENRVVRITKDGPVHRIKDLTVSVALSGDLDATHLTGDNSGVLPTDTMKNTCFAFAQRHGAVEIEEYALALARHFVDSQPSIGHARVEVDEHAWERIGDGPHSFMRTGGGTRTCTVHYDGAKAWVVSGVKDLTVLNSTDSEFWGYVKDEYTTLQEAHDRILATDIRAQWRHTGESGDWGESFEQAKNALLEAFVRTHSRSLQQTLFEMGTRVLEESPELCEVRLKLPNKHHFLYDTAAFGLDNPNETFLAADRPYGLIEGDVRREDAPDAGPAWT